MAEEKYEVRCMKCKKQVEIKDGEEYISKNNMRMMKGICPECGTKLWYLGRQSK